jgi:GR25 family glycosyltransferase involved in LPS biosynthesis
MKTAVASFLAVLSCTLCIIDLSFRYWDQRLSLPDASGSLNILSKVEFSISECFSRRHILRFSWGDDRLRGVDVTENLKDVLQSGRMTSAKLCPQIEFLILFFNYINSIFNISFPDFKPLIYVAFQLADGSRRLNRGKGFLPQDEIPPENHSRISVPHPVRTSNAEPEHLSPSCFQPVDKSKSVPVYWINLQKSNQRRKFYAHQMESMKLPNLMIKAVTPNSEVVKKTTITVIPRVLHTQVELSCVVSHLIAIYTAVHDEKHKLNPYALITEDDVHYEMDVDFLTMAENAPKGFGSLQLITSSSVHVTNYWAKYKAETRIEAAKQSSTSSKSIKKGSKKALSEQTPVVKFDHEAMWTLRKHDSPYWSTQAYLISKKVAQPFIDSVVTYNNSTNTYSIDIVNPSEKMFPCPGNRDCYLPYRIVADTYLYSGCSPTYLTKIPIFNGAHVGQNSTIHSRKNNNVYHAKAFAQISDVLKDVRNSTDVLPPYIRVKKCDVSAPVNEPSTTRHLNRL